MLCEEDREEDEWWLSQENGFSHGLFLPNVNDYAHAHLYEGWLKKDDFRTVQLEGDDLQVHYDWLMEIPVAKSIFDEMEAAGMERPEWQKLHAAYFSKGYLVIITREPCPEDAIFKRFAQVFDLTYTRFLDLQKAEAQAREAQIENALEKVRSRSLAMHNSDELNEVVKVLFEKMTELNIPSTAVSIQTFSEDSRDMQCFVCGDVGTGMVINQYLLPYFDHPILNDYIGAHKKGLDHYVGTYSKEVKDSLYEVVLGLPELKDIPAEVKAMISKSEFYEITMVPAKKSTLAVNDFHGNPLSESQIAILKRFAKVFDQAYTRFLDLQKAEAQARESQIENALEKVRSRSLAMQSPHELIDVAQLLREEMGALGVEELETSSIFILEDSSGKAQCWFTTKDADNPDKSVSDQITINLQDTWVGRQMNEFYASGQDTTSILTKGEHRVEWFRYIEQNSDQLGKTEFFEGTIPERTVHLCKFPHGFLGAASPGKISIESWDLMKRATGVFSFAYTRFRDLQKAEAQAREAKIEAALEKVRSRSLAMHKADELKDVVLVLVEKLQELDVVLDANGVILCTYFKDSRDVVHWIASPDFSFAGRYHLPYFDHPIFSDAWESKEKGDEYFSKAFSVEEKNSFFSHAFEHSDYKYFPEEFKQWVFKNDQHLLSFAWQKNSAILIPSHTGVVPTEDQIEILKRFSRVFEQAYIRFMDLQNAEVQAREAQIENALEKVRSRSLAMQSPDELIEVAELLREEMGALGVEELETSSIYIHNGESGTTQCWFTIKDTTKPGKNITDQMTIDLQDTWVGREMNDFYSSAEKRTSIRMQGEQRIEWMRYCEEKSDLFTTRDFYGDNIPDRTYHLYKFSNGYIGAASPGEISDESWDLLRRATSVFSFAYTRFLDLKKAKEQTREAQIELALERIRARVTGMQESSDLLDIVVTMRTEFVNLGHEAHYFWHMRWLPDTYKKAMTSGDGTKIGMVMTLPRHIHGDIQEVAAWEKTKDPIHVLAMDVDAAVDYVDKMITLGDFERVDPQAPSLDDIRHIGGLTFVMARTTHGEIGFSLPGVVPDPPKDSVDTLVRFAGVFDLAYRRFEDLKKAEAQARENRIELALERTRNQSMLMQHSDEIKGISDVFHQQLLELNIPSEFSYVWLPDESKNNHQFWASWAEQKKGELIFNSKQVTYPLDKSEPYTAACYKAWEDQENVHLEFIPPADIPDFFNTWTELLEGAGNLSAKNFTEGIFYAEAYMRYGCFGINVRRELSTEEKQVLKRFSIEFERAYTRFLDLQKAEARARESQVELSLERIRGKVTAMQESSDLFDIVVGMRKEFISLGNEADYFWHMRWLPDIYEMSMTSEDGSRVGMVISIPKFVHDNIPDLAAWEKGNEATYALALDAEAAWDYIDNMNTHGHYEQADPNAPTQEDIEHIGGLTFIIARTTHGEIGYSLPGMVPNPPKEALDTLVRFAGVFDLAYKRFEDLKTAERDLIELKEARQRAENALTELKATQTQLIQQEKLAGLGQLTAGIAHEIKNPLNFVNNFSEVSGELIDEAFEELEKLADSEAKEEVIAILTDVKSNMTKVHEHGTRADGIVKSMLQHSRGGSGKMEPTDLNALVKEYVNLSFHGMRAKKNPINAEIDLQLDPTIKTLPLIGEDFSRVVLNLCNNAFDAMRETADQRPPKLVVSTERAASPLGVGGSASAIQISFTDNGPGIPDDLKDKIMQPFFTTKKGTEGTGLGLSITNDIIKAHGGSLDIEAKPGKTNFRIILNL
ncbi:MAG TPA: ATP-binding protein [Cryomorphaceae bacterium]|nr:ATP-binding protein [Cryomorphaceae bacterium]